MNSKQIIIGVTGHPSCGKDTVAEYLVAKHGFTFFSTSDEVRRYIKENNLGEPTRELMNATAQKMRREFGAAVTVDRAIIHGANAERLAIGGMRAVAESRAIQKVGGKVITVTAPIEIRFERALARGRIGDGVTLAKFKELEDREATTTSTDPAALNVNTIITESDYSINNTGSLDDLHKNVDEIIGEILGK